MGASNVTGSGTVNILDSTLTGNTAQGGSGDTAANGGSGLGAAVFNLDGSATLNNDTIDANTNTAGAGGTGGSNGLAGGTVYNLAFGNVIQTGGANTATLTLNNNIVANTTGGSELAAQNIAGAQTNTASIVGSTNLVQTNNIGSGVTLASGVITSTANPNLGPLQNNGGLTPTMAVNPGSAAYGAGNASIGGLPATDQRGLARISTQGLDLGAFEYQTVTPFPAPTPSPTPTPKPSDPSPEVELLFLAEDQFAWSVDSMVLQVSSDPTFTQAADRLMSTLNSFLDLYNPALETGLAGLQSAINANPYYGTPWGQLAQAVGFDLASIVFAAQEHL
jgi:hypothetical protein